ARAYFENAAANGNSTAEVWVTGGMVNGLLGTVDVEGGLARLLALAEAGNVSATNMLGDIYSRGSGVDVDGPRAISFYEAGAAQGNNTSLLRLGEIYRDGILVSADPERARAYFENAAAN